MHGLIMMEIFALEFGVDYNSVVSMTPSVLAEGISKVESNHSVRRVVCSTRFLPPCLTSSFGKSDEF